MTPEDRQQLDFHVREIAQILHSDAQTVKLIAGVAPDDGLQNRTESFPPSGSNDFVTANQTFLLPTNVVQRQIWCGDISV